MFEEIIKFSDSFMKIKNWDQFVQWYMGLSLTMEIIFAIGAFGLVAIALYALVTLFKDALG